MRSSLRRLGVALALSGLILVSRPAPGHSQQDPGFRLFACAVTCLFYTVGGQCTDRTPQQCAAWYTGCVEGCMFAI